MMAFWHDIDSWILLRILGSVMIVLNAEQGGAAKTYHTMNILHSMYNG